LYQPNEFRRIAQIDHVKGEEQAEPDQCSRLEQCGNGIRRPTIHAYYIQGKGIEAYSLRLAHIQCSLTRRDPPDLFSLSKRIILDDCQHTI
jgi:hypothetical protein